ncbi:hypothetical protein Kpol_1051p40 [Vanderwaltozyma polyspora DSM 70294]|uniref:Chitin synthase export chaperone n=1 Tax=Vanderwaltozyma polyspora (strain ATCC 22028 / DSM 70294 / BCRC 21397 / CBS 2163 / NBRC 10782 / NRRL Y-8283 / UCD 57-17) TaxID=436907 RepID=A7TN02_VANPO|nr:uncharacterized protein Kpol_1051p40 [Vanderwaltozyma polyspora DSM 70294]EDO16390.1 hypothetical protein Kpol_1051p40 [Vanderwaltozyma polyspora DSM 70294]
MTIKDFAAVCSKTPLPLCSVVKSTKHLVLSNSTVIDNFNPQNFRVGILPRCYARPIELANTMIFGIGNAFINIGALGVILIIIYNIRQKYTAIGRSEYLYFFQLILLYIILTLVVNCGVSPPGSDSYPYLVAIHLGVAGSCCWTLLINGFLSFNLWEDGTVKSMVIVRGFSAIGFIMSFLSSILTFKSWIQDDKIASMNTTAIFVIVYVINGIALLIYTICQLLVSLLVVRNLWVTGSVFLGLFFFIVGQVLVYGFSVQICEGVKHYLDGLFFGSLCNVFTLMMVYKTWDMTTDDDLEFSVSVNKDGNVAYN